MELFAPYHHSELHCRLLVRYSVLGRGLGGSGAMNTLFKANLPSPILENISQCEEIVWLVVVVCVQSVACSLSVCIREAQGG